MTYDFIVIGAGSAGCVLANRLSRDSGVRVLLLEAGGPDRKTEIKIPAAFSKLLKTEIDWNYETEPQEHLAGRRLFWPRGKVLGGTSSINAMIYIRGHRSTFDDWAAAGNTGWSYDDLLPLFRRSENFEGGESPHHGVGGPLNVAAHRDPNPLDQVFLEAASEAGLPRTADFNGDSQAGAGRYHVTQKRGRRHSTASAFLKPVLRRRNLTVVTGALAREILFEGQRAVGVEYAVNGRSEQVLAGETVVCGGAINSPQLLMLSGVGPASELEALGIDLVCDLPGVGKNLRDHLVLTVNQECTQPITLANAESIGNLLKFLLFGKGMLTSNVAEAGAFVRLDPQAPAPELQFHFGPSYFVNHGYDNPEGHGVVLGPTLVQPQSVGEIKLRSTNPDQAPAIDPKYLSHPADLNVLIEGIRLARKILAASPFDSYRGREVLPGEAVESDRDLAASVRQRAQTIYHPVGTCKMGSDSMSVVDDCLSVHGTRNLRVADASIMPTITNGNTNAPAIMIGEKAGEILAG